MNRLAVLAIFLAIVTSLTTSFQIISAIGHPGGFFVNVIAVGYGVKIINVNRNTHISADKLSASTELVGSIRTLYKINYTLQARGTNAILVSAPNGIEVAFKPNKQVVWKAKIIGHDSSSPSFEARTEFESSVDGINSYVIAKTKTKDFRITTYSNGSYDLKTSGVGIAYPTLNNPFFYNYTKASYKVFSNSTYIGYIYNFTNDMVYRNTTSGHIQIENATMNITALARRDGKEAIVLVDYFGYAYRNYDYLIDSGEKGRFIFKVNETGWYINRLIFKKWGTQIVYNFATTLPASGKGPLNMTKINPYNPLFRIEIGGDGDDETFVYFQIGKELYMSVEKLAAANTEISYVQPGLWIFNGNGRVNLTMYIYPTISGYKQIYVKFIKE